MAEKPKRGRRKLTEEEKAANRIKRTSAKRKERQEARKKEKELKKKLQQELQIIKREPVRAIVLQKKRLYLEEFFNTINVRNDPLNQIKKNIIQLLSELVENKIIQNEVEVILKSGKKKYHLIKNLTTSDITRRIKYIQLHEILPKIG